MKYLKALALLASVSFSVQAFACPESNETMQAKLGERNGQKFCAIRATDPNKPAEILKTTTFNSDTLYIIGSGLYVGDNKMRTNNEDKIQLIIEPGTRIMGQSEKAYIQINRGAQIIAKGEKDAPIVFTTARRENVGRGSWGGLVINGSAPVNGCSTGVCELKGEGLTDYTYGGPNPEDSSGVLNYVVVEYAGYEITTDNELNGIAFQGVGNKTEVDFVQVHMNADDGVEFFGGTVNVKHLVLTGNKDDSLDWTSGWTGSAQFVIIDQHADAGNYGIEADNFSKNHASSPRSFPTLANFTLIGSDKSQGARGGSGILLRRGTGANILNSYITGFSNSCFDMDDVETFRHAKEDGGVVLQNVAFNCQTTFTPIEKIGKEEDAALEPWGLENFVMAQTGNRIQDFMLSGYVPVEGSNFVEGLGSVFRNILATDYIGAVKDSSDRWYEGWTTK